MWEGADLQRAQGTTEEKAHFEKWVGPAALPASADLETQQGKSERGWDQPRSSSRVLHVLIRDMEKVSLPLRVLA